MRTNAPVTRDELLAAVHETISALLDALTNAQQSGLLDRQIVILERLTERVERLELELMARRPDPN